MADDFWGNFVSEIILCDGISANSLNGIEDFSHLEIVFYFDKADRAKTVTGASRPRGNANWPETGIFAQRKKDRPNHLGTSIVRFLKKQDRKLVVSGLDAIDGTPVIDIKPVFREFLPVEEIKQPDWVSELMEDYFKKVKL
jgi:tRNA-Thr(GGU) m(6)t(6)A37 methyltransferase TsaA